MTAIHCDQKDDTLSLLGSLESQTDSEAPKCLHSRGLFSDQLAGSHYSLPSNVPPLCFFLHVTKGDMSILLFVLFRLHRLQYFKSNTGFCLLDNFCQVVYLRHQTHWHCAYILCFLEHHAVHTACLCDSISVNKLVSNILRTLLPTNQ